MANSRKQATCAFPGVTDDDLARARSDPAFRQKLLTESLETLLAEMQKLRKSAPSATSSGEGQLREGVELAVRLAELIQKVDGHHPGAGGTRSHGGKVRS
jgi:phage shock protein A